MIVANHASHLDTLAIISALPLGKLHRVFPAAAKDFFFESLPRTALASILVNALPFDRRTHVRQSLSLCKAVLEKPGNILVIYPEATRSTTGEIGEFRPGISLLLAGSDLSVVPCHLDGTFRAWPKGGSVSPAAKGAAADRPAAPLHRPEARQGGGRGNLPRPPRGGARIGAAEPTTGRGEIGGWGNWCQTIRWGNWCQTYSSGLTQSCRVRRVCDDAPSPTPSPKAHEGRGASSQTRRTLRLSRSARDMALRSRVSGAPDGARKKDKCQQGHQPGNERGGLGDRYRLGWGATEVAGGHHAARPRRDRRCCRHGAGQGILHQTGQSGSRRIGKARASRSG